ncbi:MAG: transposase [Gammaproteobacteria bacterium]|nr:transposase [Gammaproteobacteria bacterium]
MGFEVSRQKDYPLHDFIARTVKDEVQTIHTDELKSYLGIEDYDSRHETVNHSQEQWVIGDVRTNSIKAYEPCSNARSWEHFTK